MTTDRWYQTEAVEAVGPYFARQKKGNPLIGLPTGTGKSRVSARINYNCMKHFPFMRGLNLTHVKELVGQNTKGLLNVWPEAPVGVLSAGLNQYDTQQPIIFGGVATVVNKLPQLGHRHYILIDEAHLVSDSVTAQYQQIIRHFRKLEPNLVVCGLSATLYRMRMGGLTEGSVFDTIAYDLTNMEGFNRLLAEGYLCPLVPQGTTTRLDTEKIGRVGDDFNKGQLERAVDKSEIISACVDEILERAWDRNCWMIFASGVSHAEHIADELNSRGIPTCCVHSKRKDSDKLLEAFMRGEYKCVVNYGKLTTGFDHPPIDFIGMMRPTMSPALWVQMLGRGTRPYDGRLMSQYRKGFEYVKHNCLVLDFGGNAERLGPINDPIKPRKPGEKGGIAPIKQCPQCRTYHHASARVCDQCSHVFPFTGSVINTEAGTTSLIRNDEEFGIDIQEFKVSRVLYSLISKAGSPPMMRVSYVCGIKKFDQIVCVEHNTAARYRAVDWWKMRYGSVPATTDEGLAIAHSGALMTPKVVRVWVNKKPYPEIMSMEF